MRSQVPSRKAQPEALNTTLERATTTKESVYNRARMGGGGRAMEGAVFSSSRSFFRFLANSYEETRGHGRRAPLLDNTRGFPGFSEGTIHLKCLP